MDKFVRMVADHMEAGFLENIIDMLKHDKAHFGLIPGLIADERQRVRIGALVLIETFLEKNRPEIMDLVPSICDALKNENPVVRADAAYMLSVIGDEVAINCLKNSLMDPHPIVSGAAKEAIHDILQKNGLPPDGIN
ncbi:MAG: HEAT repeat domain-containing protein [Nitrospiraceae bacterium]|nr:HEAT repeat domain-containing protein [Nitrospiraceae bacterium]